MGALISFMGNFVTLPGNPAVGWLLVLIDGSIALAVAIKAVGQRKASHGIGYLVALIIAVALFAVLVGVEYLVISAIIAITERPWLGVVALVILAAIVALVIQRFRHNKQRPMC